MAVNIVKGDKEYFPFVDQVKYEGPESDNPFAFKYYNPEQVVAGKTMEEHFRFSVAWWHSFCGRGDDPFGPGPRPLPWEDDAADRRQAAAQKADAGFEFITKMGIPFFCFHDVDLIAPDDDVKTYEQNLEFITDYVQEKMKASGVQLLWGTANLFGHPRYMNGASTNPDFHVLTKAGAQVKNALDATIKLGGHNYVFWGGREGYYSLLNTNMKREKDHLAMFLKKARDYGRANGFKGNFLIEPKPAEPTKHQYDYDTETVLGFLEHYDLLDDFQINVETNHATLAQHTFQHELQAAADAGKLGSIDANRGDYQNGWDTDQFPNNIYELTEAWLVILEAGGFQGGGTNFDAKLRRSSVDMEDLFHAHIGGMDVFARALLAADKVMKTTDYQKLRRDRYGSYDSGEGKRFEKGELSLEELRNLAAESGEPELRSGKQEYFENILNSCI